MSISHPDHFVNVARRRAASEEGAIFANQFENLANFRAHLDTGPSSDCLIDSTYVHVGMNTCVIKVDPRCDQHRYQR